MKKYIILLAAAVCLGCMVCNQAGLFDTTTETISGVLEDLPIEDRIVASDLVILGTVQDISDPFYIESASGAASIFTDYTITPQKVLRGTTDADRVTLRLQGGKIGRRETIVEENPELSIGDNALFLLYQPHMGGGFNTLGEDYYYLKGLEQGVLYTTTDTNCFETEDGESIDLAALPQMLSEADEPDPNSFRNNCLEGLNHNLEEGFISQEEYDDFVQRMDRYAHIVE